MVVWIGRHGGRDMDTSLTLRECGRMCSREPPKVLEWPKYDAE